MTCRHWRLLWVALCLRVFVLPAFGVDLIPAGSLWRWRPGTNEASNPISSWRLFQFNDAQFSLAPAPFWFGDVLPGGTEIQGMRNVYGCIFLRKTFVVQDPSDISGLRMNALVDDGFVTWINGTEVLRVGMPGDPGSSVTTRTLANNAAEPIASRAYALPSPAYLLAGTNVLAVQVFQSNLGSSDLAFEASLEATLKETIPPTISTVTPVPGTTVDSFTDLTVTFSEPVEGVVAAHLLVNGIGAVTAAALDEHTFRFSFASPPYGTVSIRWSSNHTIQDLAEPPNRFDAEAPGSSWEITLVDRTPPVVAGILPTAGSTVRSFDSISILFTEAVAGVEASDLLINGQPASAMTQVAARQYIFTFPAPTPGLIQMVWAANHGIVDQGSPPNAFAGASWTTRLDPDAPEPSAYISEIMASNTRGLQDDFGEPSDWIEIYNPAPTSLNLDGWYLTDSTNDLNRWRFPATNLAGRAFMVVFASGRDRLSPGARLHTDFQLSAEGEYLALVKPDGTTIVSEFAPVFPQQVPDVSHGFAQIEQGGSLEQGPAGVYFTTPTPGQPNIGGTVVPGPVLTQVQHSPVVPRDDDDLLVTTHVSPAFLPIDEVEFHYRIQFGPETTAPMFDDGAHADGAAGDGLFGAWIPANLSTNGQMIRYYITASDSSGNTSRWPMFTDRNSTEEYLGTVVDPTYVTSKLPVFHLFVAPGQLSRIDTESGGRASFFHDGEFYDNIYVELRGNTSAGLNKKSHRIEFTRGHDLRHAAPGGGRTRRSSLLSEYLDPTYLRQHLCFWLLNNIGVPAPYNYPVRVQLNGQFYQLAFHSDVIGNEQIERMGYDPDGALYKAVGTLTPDFYSTGVFEKLEPEDDPSHADYLQLATGINESSPTSVRRQTVFDLLDLPQVINHLAGTRWCAENDDVWANMSLYRDTHGDGLWRNIPFDMNASWGQLYGGSNPLEATVDSSKSHPLYGGSSTEGTFNRLYDVIVRLPETRQMLLRRQRSILDQWVQPPQTPQEERILENYVRYMTNLIAPEAALDRAKWGSSPWAPGKTFAAGVNDLINQFIVPRRRHWYVTHSITNKSRPIGINSSNNAGIPLAQPDDVQVHFFAVDFNPTSGNQNEEFIALSNAAPVAVDLTGWSVDRGVRFTFHHGTVLPTNMVLYVSPDIRQFRSRAEGPRGGQGLFVVGPYSGQLSARGETLTLRDDRGRVVHTYTYAGAPSMLQQYLRVTEIMYHPEAQPGNTMPAEDFEFIELSNISTTETLDLAGVHFSNGIQFDFGTGLITRLAPGERLVLAANTIALRSRYGEGLPIAGEYTGRLDNAGERLRLLDRNNEEIMDFEYQDDWYGTTDGLGFSLVVLHESAPADAWSDKSQWQPGSARGGSPGRAEPSVEPVLKIDSFQLAPDPRLRFFAISNRTYSVQVSETLRANGWKSLQDFASGSTNRILEVPIVLTNGASESFYRLVTPRQP